MLFTVIGLLTVNLSLVIFLHRLKDETLHRERTFSGLNHYEAYMFYTLRQNTRGP